jgi:hypothetical protein
MVHGRAIMPQAPMAAAFGFSNEFHGRPSENRIFIGRFILRKAMKSAACQASNLGHAVCVVESRCPSFAFLNFLDRF